MVSPFETEGHHTSQPGCSSSFPSCVLRPYPTLLVTYFFWFSCSFVHIHMCIGLHAHVYMCTQEITIRCLPCSFSVLLLEPGSLAKCIDHHFSWWLASEPQGSCPSSEWITVCLITFSFKWVWDQILVLTLVCFANRAIFSILENFVFAFEKIL